MDTSYCHLTGKKPRTNEQFVFLEESSVCSSDVIGQGLLCAFGTNTQMFQ